MPAQATYLVEWLAEAVTEVTGMENKKERVGVLTAVDKLFQVGPSLPFPHAKSLKDEPDLFELRPRGGASAARVIYIRVGDGLKLLAIAETHDDLPAAIARARDRMSAYGLG